MYDIEASILTDHNVWRDGRLVQVKEKRRASVALASTQVPGWFVATYCDAPDSRRWGIYHLGTGRMLACSLRFSQIKQAERAMVHVARLLPRIGAIGDVSHAVARRHAPSLHHVRTVVVPHCKRVGLGLPPCHPSEVPH